MATSTAPGLTHRQIAEQLGVSRQLVGFALRGEGRVSEEMRQRILELAQAGGYDRYSNGAARSMAARRHGKHAATGIVAVLFSAVFEGRPLSSVPFFTPFFEGVETEVIERGLDLMLCPLRAEGLPRLIRENQVDGVICLGMGNSAPSGLDDCDIPMVNILHTKTGAPLRENWSVLSIDAAVGGRKATQHLLDLGHRRIGFLGCSHDNPDENAFEIPIFRGYRETMESAGLSLENEWIDRESKKIRIEEGEAAARRLLEKGAPQLTALVCDNDLLAMGAVRALEAAGYRVPGDISVVGYDDVSTQYAFQPALTSIRYPREAMGRRAVYRLYETEPGPQIETFAVELIERNSTMALEI
jgi:DNA-binding LacI/PurR family transcriptional regulator